MEVVVLEIDRENRRISLGHKQLEENPWEVFESTFAEGTTHTGTIIDNKDKSGIVSLTYGLEGICPARHMRKEDGSNAKVEESLEFVVIEFNKDSRKIVVSHTATFEEMDEKSAKGKPSASTAKGGGGSSTSNAVSSLNASSEKSTLGDLDALAELKQKMEGEGK